MTRVRAVPRCSMRETDLLADEAALVEVDAVKLIHVGFVREGVAIDEVGTAARHAKRDPVRLVVVGGDQLRAELGRGFRTVDSGGRMQRVPSSGRRGSR